MNNNIITTITNQQINNRVNDIRNPFQTVQTSTWLTNYRLEINTNIPVINRVRGFEVLDSEGIRNLNENTITTNNFIDSVQNNTNELVINQNTNLLSNEFIENSQNLINNNSRLNAPLMSVFLNNPDLNNLIENLRNNLSNFNENNYDELIGPFMNSFMIFLTTNSNIDLVELNSFYESLRELELGISTLLLNQENLITVNRINNENRINLERHLTTVQSLFERLSDNTNNALQEILNSSNIRQEEITLQGMIENEGIIDGAEIESIQITSNSIEEIEKQKEETIKKLKKLFFNKKTFILILSSLIISQIGITLPWGSILRQFNSQNSIQTVPIPIVTTPPTTSENIVRIRDIWDIVLKNIKDYLKKD